MHDLLAQTGPAHALDYSLPPVLHPDIRDSGGGHGGESGESHGSGGHGGHDVNVCGFNPSNCKLQRSADCERELCAEKFTFIVFPLFALFIGVLATPLSRATKIPYTLFLLMTGIVLGFSAAASRWAS